MRKKNICFQSATILFAQRVLFFLLIMICSGCTAYQMNGKSFYSQRKALAAFDQLLDTQLANIPSYSKAGGSVLVLLPPDQELNSAPFIIGTPTPVMKQYFVEFYKRDFKGVQRALKKTGCFDSVELIAVENDVYQFAHSNSYDCVLKNKGDGSWLFSNPNQSKEIIIQPKSVGLPSLVDAICADAPRAMVYFKVLQD